MSNRIYPLYIIVLLSLCLFLIVTVLYSQAGAQDSKKNDTATEIDSKYVCMINDQLFNKEQIPIEVEGKTYYGCCKMCEAKLKTDPNSRESIDPVSNKKVDKALSVIGAAPDGSVYYFENETNLQKYNTK